MVGFYYVFNDSDGASIKRRICKIISAALIRGRRSLKILISNTALIRGRRSIGGGAQTSNYGKDQCDVQKFTSIVQTRRLQCYD